MSKKIFYELVFLIKYKYLFQFIFECLTNLKETPKLNKVSFMYKLKICISYLRKRLQISPNKTVAQWIPKQL